MQLRQPQGMGTPETVDEAVSLGHSFNLVGTADPARLKKKSEAEGADTTAEININEHKAA